MTRRSLCCLRVGGGLEEGREGGLIEFGVGGEAVEVEDEGF